MSLDVVSFVSKCQRELPKSELYGHSRLSERDMSVTANSSRSGMRLDHGVCSPVQRMTDMILKELGMWSQSL